MLKQNQHQRLAQSQKLSPQQIQLMKLLQIPTALLDQRIEEELEINPALEDAGSENHEQEETRGEEEEFYDGEDAPEKEFEEDIYSEESAYEEQSLDDYLEDYLSDDTPDYRLDANLYSADQEEKDNPSASELSFHEYLEEQIGMLNLSEKEQRIALQIIGTIEPSGYLSRSTADLADDLAFGQNLMVTEAEVEAVLKLVQDLDPPGIAARNLQECLAIQLERKLRSDEVKQHYSEDGIQALKLAKRIITDYFEEFSKKHYSKLLRQLNLYEDDLKEATEEVYRLNPKPGSAYAPATRRREQHVIIPDFLVENKLGELDLQLNARNAPELRISEHYREMLETYSHNRKDKKQKEAALFVKQKIDSARWFIDAIKQRHQTMFKCMSAILEHQKDFFLTGDEKRIRPIILKDIAEITGLDISTVSRVANSKYVQTEFGTKRLKEFFSESLQTDSGEEVSTLEVKKILTEMISGENKRRPHSDEKLKDELQRRGYNIARRTVAKYREQLGIPVARLRKEL